MRTLVLLFLIGALGACGKKPEPVVVPPAQVEDRNPFFTEQAQPAAPVAQAPVQQQLPAPQAAQAQTDSGPGWGSVLAAGAVGYLLGNSNKPAVAPAPAPRPVVIYRDAPKPVVPVTPPRPNTVTAVQPPKPQVVAPAPTYAPPTQYVQRQNTPTTTSVPTAPRTTTSTPYKSTWSSTTRSVVVTSFGTTASRCAPTGPLAWFSSCPTPVSSITPRSSTVKKTPGRTLTCSLSTGARLVWST